MVKVYSTYEAKAKFSEIIRRVRGGTCVVIAFRGEHVAEVRPIGSAEEKVDARLRRLEDEGVLIGPEGEGRGLRPVVRKPGALSRARFKTPHRPNELWTLKRF